MEPTTLSAFAVALTVAALLPGPGMTAVVARALGHGFWGTMPLIFGMIAGDLVFLSCAALGLAALAATFATLFVVVKIAGAGYLLWLAWRLWTAEPHAERVGAARGGDRSVPRVLLGGFVLTLGNPKTIVFYMALLPTVIDLSGLTAVGFGELVAIVFADLLLVGAAYAALAAKARDVFADTSARRILDRTAGAMMAGAAVAVATR